jgi:hypothetical protein
VLFFVFPCAAKDVTVLVDVSGTMAKYGAWQPDARLLVSSILRGTPQEIGWQRQGRPDLASEFKVSAGERVHLLRFGSIISEDFPYFRQAQVIDIPTELERIFPVSASEYTEPRTNKALAVAVGSQLSADSRGASRLIIISDFLVDSDLSVKQQAFVNAFDSQVQTQAPLIYSWANNAHLQVRLISFNHVAVPTTSATPTTPVDCSVRLSGARMFEAPKRVDFSWKAESPGCEGATFSITVQDPRKGSVVFSRGRILGSSVLWPNPKSGSYVWRVTADLGDQSSVTSPSAPLEVPSASWLPIIAGLFALVGAVVLVWWYSNRRAKARRPLRPEEKPTWKN